MKKIKSDKKERGRNLSKISGLVFLALVMLVSIAGAEPFATITFVTTGSSFSPIITVTGNPTIQWTFGDGSTSNSKSPTVNFGSAGTRENTLVVTPWSAVTKINIGYDGSDGGVTPSSSTIANLKQQNVVAVTGLENVAPYLQIWASNSNPIISLDFSNFTALHTIECFSCKSLATIKLRNVPSLTRLCVEQSNISFLDLSEAPSLADLRGASQSSSTYTINWGTTGTNIWHICVRDNPQITGTFPFNQFPLLRDFFNWNDNQSGTLHLTSTNLREVLSSNNYYSAAVFSGCFPAGGNGVVEIQNNNLKSLDISNDPGLLYLNASFNSLDQTAVDGILQTLDFYDTNGGYLDLTGNAAPSIIGIEYASNLTARNWEVKTSSRNNPPVANFTSNVTFGTTPLEVQFNDTSINNPTTWLWDFGDGTYSTEEFPKHIYPFPGNYTVTLEVRNSNGSDSKAVVITFLEQPVLPLANFSSNVTEGSVPLDVHFYDLSENTAERYWNFGDGTDSTETDPTHAYSVAGNYSVNLTVSNANGTASKTATINVLQAASSGSDGSISDGSSSIGGTNGGGSGGGGNIGSPELLDNIESKEMSMAFVVRGNYVKFDFPENAAPVVYIAFDAKTTPGKITTIVEMLNKKSILVPELPSDEVYKSLNIWAGNNGFIIPKNIENAVVCFKVEKSWIKDKKIDQSSITLNRYSDNEWDQLPTGLSEEDDKYLYFTAQTPGFSPFAITGRTTATGTEIQPANGSETYSDTETAILPKPNTEIVEKKDGNTAANIEPAPEKQQSPDTSGKESTKTPGFATVFGAVILNIGLLACLLYFFIKK